MTNNQLTALNINGEKVLISTFIGKNRCQEIMDWHTKVFEYFKLPINYIYLPFELGYPYGEGINQYVNQTLNSVDYYIFMDMDAIPLRKDTVILIIDKIKDKESIWGLSQQSTHILKNGIPNHPYAGFSSCAFSKDLYIKLGKPTFSETARGDIGEELTWKCEELGYNVCLSYPTEFHELTDEEMKNTGNARHGWVNNGIKLGLGTTFGNGLVYHSFHTSCKPGTNELAIPRAAELFIKKAKQAIGEENWLGKALDDAKEAKKNWPDWAKNKKERKLELITGCVNTDKIKYSKFLEITLKENVKHFDGIYVAGVETDLETKRVCEENGAIFCPTNDFYKNGSKFDNNAAFNSILHLLEHKDWILAGSPDIVFLPDFREKLKLEELREDTLYGINRCFITKYQDWVNYKEGKRDLDSFETLESHGNGFTQIINLSSEKLRGIPLNETFPSNGQLLESDILTLRRFHPNVRDVGKLNIVAIHLGDKNNGGKIRENKEIIEFFD